MSRYRGVPGKVDAQRARRRVHRQAPAAADVEIAAGRRPPPNPWSRETAFAAVSAAIVVGHVVLLVTYIRRRPLARHFRRAAHEPAPNERLANTEARTPAEDTDNEQP